MSQYILGMTFTGGIRVRALVLERTNVAVVSPENADDPSAMTQDLKILGFAFVNVAALKRAGWQRIRGVRGQRVELPRFVSESQEGELTLVEPSGERRRATAEECVGLFKGVGHSVGNFEEYCLALLGRMPMPHWGRLFGH